MTAISANGITIEYDTFGEASNPPLLLVMGLGAQMIAWDEALCQSLADSGHFVIRYDNRDVGMSTWLKDHPIPDMEALIMARLQGQAVEVPYTLSDMAADGMALLTALEIEQAHVCGASLGGMVVQTMAIDHPKRVLSLTSIMSSTGNPELPTATPEASEALMSERVDDPNHAMERSVAVARVIGSTGFPRDEAKLREKALRIYERGYYPDGVARQLAAVLESGDRRPSLQGLDVPALVIHGAADPLIQLAGGTDTHENISGSELLVIEGMGHDLPPGAWPEMVAAISTLTGAQQ